MGLWNKGGTKREVILREQKDWKKINQKWASMVSHMSLLNVFFCSCCLIVTVLHNYQLFCSELFGFWGVFLQEMLLKSPNNQQCGHSISYGVKSCVIFTNL